MAFFFFFVWSLAVFWVQANGVCQSGSDAVMPKVCRFSGFWAGKE